MEEEVTVKQEPSMEDDSIPAHGKREDLTLSTDRKDSQFPPPVSCVDVKCELQVCFHFF
jgi:hypothetical protein